MLWRKSYETGNTQVDDEHKEIFRMVESLVLNFDTTPTSEIEKTITFLAEYTVDHFVHEEALMEESSYPGFDEHKKQHSDFVQEVVKLQERVNNRMNEALNSIDVKIVIASWLVDHVLGSDKTMAQYYRKYVEEKEAEEAEEAKA